jgi:ubiquinone/menaquinone biosynthesis C-methylase UbiE
VFERYSLTEVVSGYDRMARWYRFAAPLVALPPGMRRRAVGSLQLRLGETALDVGCGTGRNLALLREAVGADGRVIGIDASSGMLARASSLAARHRWQNVSLVQQDAAVPIAARVDAALFSLSYSVLPDRAAVLSATWGALRDGGRLVVMDAGLPESRLGRLLRPVGETVARIFPGDPYSKPWQDLKALSQSVEVRRFQFGTYFICTVVK